MVGTPYGCNKFITLCENLITKTFSTYIASYQQDISLQFFSLYMCVCVFVGCCYHSCVYNNLDINFIYVRNG